MSNVLTPGAKDGVELPDGRHHLSELGLRLLAIDRPGLGRSTPHPTKTLTTWTDDVRWLVEHRGLGQIATMGFSQGAPFAFALAGSGAAHAVAIAAGQDDMLSVRHLLHPDVAAMVDAAAHAPARFERDIAETVFLRATHGTCSTPSTRGRCQPSRSVRRLTFGMGSSTPAQSTRPTSDRHSYSVFPTLGITCCPMRADQSCGPDPRRSSKEYAS